MARADYGIDAPPVVAWLGGSGVALLAAGIVGRTVAGAPAILAVGLWPAISLLTTAIWMVVGSKVLKVRARERWLDSMPWRGNERVLDVGCGRGLMLCG